MEIIQIINEIYKASQRLDKASKQIFEISKKNAEAERDYRKALATEIITLKASGLQSNLVVDVAKGNCHEMLYQRDVAEGLYIASKESIRAIETQISALQTISKYSSEVGG